MLTNATLTSIALPAAADAAGDVPAPTPGAALSVRCLATEPSRSEKFTDDSRERRWDLIVMVLQKPLLAALSVAGYPSGTTPTAGQIWAVQSDGADAAASYRVEDVKGVAKGSLTHWRVELKSI